MFSHGSHRVTSAIYLRRRTLFFTHTEGRTFFIYSAISAQQQLCINFSSTFYSLSRIHSQIQNTYSFLGVSCMIAVPLGYDDDIDSLPSAPASSDEMYDLDAEQTQARYDPRVLSKELTGSHAPESHEDEYGAHCVNANERYEHGQKVIFLLFVVILLSALTTSRHSVDSCFCWTWFLHAMRWFIKCDERIQCFFFSLITAILPETWIWTGGLFVKVGRGCSIFYLRLLMFMKAIFKSHHQLLLSLQWMRTHTREWKCDGSLESHECDERNAFRNGRFVSNALLYFLVFRECARVTQWQISRTDPCEICLCVDGEVFCWWKKCGKYRLLLASAVAEHARNARRWLA